MALLALQQKASLLVVIGFMTEGWSTAWRTGVESLACRLRSKEGYQEFLKTLNLYGQDIITRGELVMMVQDILARFSDIAVRPSFPSLLKGGPELARG